jgi:hypothetical protein
LDLEVWRNGNPVSFDATKDLLLISVLFENKSETKSLRYDTRSFGLNDENDFLQSDIVGGNKSQQRISQYFPQFRIIDQQEELLIGQKVGGVILFEVNPNSQFYTLMYKYNTQIAEIKIQNPQIIDF